MLLNTGEKAVFSENGLLTTVGTAYKDKVYYALEGSVFAGGTVIKWLRDKMNLIKTASESEYIAKSLKDNGGVYFVPAFVGLGTPHWDSYARGTLVGLNLSTDSRYIVRASLESIAFQCYDVLKTMELELGKEIKSIKVDGGAALNDFLLEFQSAILDKKVFRPVVYESTAYGVYILSLIGLGLETDIEDINKKIKFDKVFNPNDINIEREKLLKYWNKALERAKNWLDN